MNMIINLAKRAGFQTALQIDNSRSNKNKKYYLLCDSRNMTTNPNQYNEKREKKICVSTNKSLRKKNNRRLKLKTTAFTWISQKKFQQRNRGKKTAKDSKFMGRKRRPKF